MKTYIKYIILWVVVTIPFVSCERFVNTREELIINVNNKTNKEFILIYETNIGTKQIYINDQETVSINFVNEQIVEVDFMGLTDLREEQSVITHDMQLYNLTDTTYFKWSEISENEIEKEIYYQHMEMIHKRNSHLNYTLYDTLTIDSTLLPIFKKDYGMLEQFSEYYK